MKNTIKPIICLICLYLCGCNAVWAAWYQVEVVVFDNLYADTDGELWYQNPGLPDRTNSIELVEVLEDENEIDSSEDNKSSGNSRKDSIVPYQKLVEEFYRLDGVQRVLKLSREYRPLLHVAWQQPGLNTRTARAVHIQQFEEAELESAVMDEDEVFDIEAMNSENDNSNDTYQVLDLLFDGTVKLRSSRFLHVDLDIAYFPESPEVDEDAISSTESGYERADYVRLQESRKIKLNEIHYFDHPLFGIILRVSRLNLN